LSGRTFKLALGADVALVQIRQLVIAGWAGRDVAAVEEHIRELEALGVRRPASVPVFYRVAATRLSVADEVEVSGNHSSGEVEAMLLQSSGRLWVGVGSDHTDREVEAYGVTVSKQMCEKPIAPALWSFDEVAGHWDQLVLRSYIEENGDRVLYQEGPVSSLRRPQELIELYTGEAQLPEDTLMFGGTLAVRGGVRPAARFMLELEDPVLHRSIRHEYRTVSLPMA
jgi:hypothetical protein